MKRRIALALTISALLLLALAIAAGVWVDRRLDSPHGVVDVPVEVQVAPGTSARALAAQLERAGLLRDRLDLIVWLWWTDQAEKIQAGEYRFDAPLSPRELAAVLIDGKVRLYPITIPEGATRWQVAAAIAAAGFGDAETALTATTNVALVADLDPEADSLEGYLYPETYMVPRATTADEAVALMVGEFRKAWSARLAARAEDLDMTVREVVTLASVIEAETPDAAERGLVSAVFHNRLRRGMLLQTDPTVLYARWLAGKSGRTIYQSDLQRDSPYNTYLHPGLPAGPIGNPRADCLEAALEPADVDYLYFVSRNDGTHAFSSTLREHNAYVNEFQRRP